MDAQDFNTTHHCAFVIRCFQIATHLAPTPLSLNTMIASNSPMADVYEIPAPDPHPQDPTDTHPCLACCARADGLRREPHTRPETGGCCGQHVAGCSTDPDSNDDPLVQALVPDRIGRAAPPPAARQAPPELPVRDPMRCLPPNEVLSPGLAFVVRVRECLQAGRRLSISTV
jgi:hypothetical protein